MDAPGIKSHIGLCVLCGLPGAGKSTLARQLRSRHNPFSVFVLSYDDVMADVAFKEDSVRENKGGKETSPWKQHRQQLLQCLEHLVIALITSSALKPPTGKTSETWDPIVQCLQRQGFISAGEDSSSMTMKSGPVYFILDDNFYYQSMRYEVFQLARKYSLGFCQLYLHCPVDCCLLRNNKRQNRVMDRTIILMDSKLEKPNPERNTWEKDSLFLDSTNDINMDEFGARITSLMSQALANPVMSVEDDGEEKERDRDICAANVIHQADQNLRRLISETMQTVKGVVSAKDIKQIAQEIQQAKSKALDQLRQSLMGKTVQDPSTESGSCVQTFREEVDCILQRYVHTGQVDGPSAPSAVS